MAARLEAASEEWDCTHPTATFSPEARAEFDAELAEKEDETPCATRGGCPPMAEPGGMPLAARDAHFMRRPGLAVLDCS